jgi:hypothetical protein
MITQPILYEIAIHSGPGQTVPVLSSGNSVIPRASLVPNACDTLLA